MRWDWELNNAETVPRSARAATRLVQIPLRLRSRVHRRRAAKPARLGSL